MSPLLLAGIPFAANTDIMRDAATPQDIIFFGSFIINHHIFQRRKMHRILPVSQAFIFCKNNTF